MKDLGPFWQTFLATLPLLGALIFNILDVRSLKGNLDKFREDTKLDFKEIRAEIKVEFKEVKDELGKIKERLSVLEDRDRTKLIK